MKVYLIGASGSGKTVIGKKVASLLGWKHIDTDEEILTQEAVGSVADIFKDRGEPYFRGREREIVEAISGNGDNVIVSTGGGLPAIDGVMDIMLQTGRVIYLCAKLDTLWKRLQVGDELLIRPLLYQQGIEALDVKFQEVVHAGRTW